MAGFNFGQIADTISEYMDTDVMSIGRRMEITNPNGTIGETNPEIPLYTNIPCHASFENVDNPDPNTVDTKPIITTILIHCSVSIDIQNGDLIKLDKLNSNGEVLESYKATCGEPITNQSRKTVRMGIKANV